MGAAGARGDGPGGFVDPGLCARCAHVRVVQSRRGSVFYLCLRSASDPSFPRYPRLPVLACRGYESNASGSDIVEDSA